MAARGAQAVVRIPLTKGKVAIVDAGDAHHARHRWYAAFNHGTWYACRCVMREGKKFFLALHREVLGVTDPRVLVDHRDGDGLNCRRRNLRAATTSQNTANRRRSRVNTSGFRGVRWKPDHRRWTAQITLAKRHHHLGYFQTAEEAARAYDGAARELFGEFACLNFPQGNERAA